MLCKGERLFDAELYWLLSSEPRRYKVYNYNMYLHIEIFKFHIETSVFNVSPV